MILVWGLASELGPVIAALRRRRAAVTFADQNDEAIEVVLGASPSEGHIRTSSADVGLAEVSAAYLKPSNPRPRSSWRNLLTWADAAPGRIVNSPSASEANGCKPYQARLIARHGFRIPETLITTDASALEKFRRRHRRIIFKSISGQRSIVTRMTRTHAQLIPNLRWCPTMFQEFVAGTEFRANVVGERVFAARVESAADDYRYGPRQGHATRIFAATLPPEVEQRVVQMSADMRLLVAGVDLRLTPDGGWTCFEVNPSPGFLYYESATGQPITEAVADLLLG